MGFYRQRTKCQFLHGPASDPAYGPAYGPANDDVGATSLARILQPHQQQRRRPTPFIPLPPSPALQLNNNARHPNKTTAPPLHQPRCPAIAAASAVPTALLPRHRRCTSRAAPPSPNSHSAGQTQPAHPVTQPAASTQSLHLVISSAGAQNPCGLRLLSPAARLRVGDSFQSQPMSGRQRGRQLPRAPR